MKKQFIFFAIVFATGIDSTAQQIPVGSCGIVHIYDAAGNRTKRLYYCNNGGTYPSRPANNNNQQNPVTTKELKTGEFEEVVALYPDPTTGIFQITFSKQLKKAVISIYNTTGKLLQRFNAAGYSITCNISSLAAGGYIVKISENGSSISKNIIKL